MLIFKETRAAILELLRTDLVTLIWALLQQYVEAVPQRGMYIMTTHVIFGPKQKKMHKRIGTWNVRRMHRAGSLRVVGEEITKYKLDLVGEQEVR
jgi:hypothetical protein